MKYLDNSGLKTIFTKMKALFVTKSELDTKLKSVGGGTEEVVYLETSFFGDKQYFKFIKKGNIVKVFQEIYYNGRMVENLPSSFIPNGNIVIGFGGFVTDFSNNVKTRYIYRRFIYFQDGILKMDNSNNNTMIFKDDQNYVIYIGQYRLD